MAEKKRFNLILPMELYNKFKVFSENNFQSISSEIIRSLVSFLNSDIKTIDNEVLINNARNQGKLKRKYKRVLQLYSDPEFSDNGDLARKTLND